MGSFNDGLAKAGVLPAGKGVRPGATGKRVRFPGSQRTVTDGPLARTDELLAGFWLWQVASMDDAVARARRWPNPMEGGSEIEIRPLFEADDFGDALAPVLRASAERLRREAGDRAKTPC